MAVSDRSEYILRKGDTIACVGGIEYTISDEPLGLGGSAIVYPAVRGDTALEYAIKECFPAGAFVRRDGVVCPAVPGDPEAVAQLHKYRTRQKTEQRIGQKVRNIFTRAVSISEILQVESITTDGRTFPVDSGAAFAVLERMDKKAISFDTLLERISSVCSPGERHRTKGLPSIHLTACIMEEVLTAIQAVHSQDIYYGDLHNGNVYFTEADPAAGKVGNAHLLDFGSAWELDREGKTVELTADDVFSTEGFRPPEMLREGYFRLTKQADIYSAGCLMLRCTATAAKLKPLGDSPQVSPDFLGQTDGTRIGCTEETRALTNEILYRALAEDPEQRYPSAEAMLQDIRRLLQETQPPQYGLPTNLSAPDYFVPGSRNRELERMEQTLKNGEAVYIWGMGGIGKTETAIALARRVQTQKGSYLIHFQNSVRDTILSLPFEGYVPPKKKRGAAGDDDYAARMAILKKYYQGALLVIDNFDAPGKSLDDMRREPAYRDLLSLDLKLVFTTRCPVSWQPENELQPLSGQDQLTLMRRYCPNSAVTDEELGLLIDEVGGNTLAISLIAKTLQNSENRVTAPALLKALRQSRLAEQTHPDIVTDQNRTYREATLYGHLTVLFNLSGMDRNAQSVMDCCAFLPPEGMEKGLLCRGLEADREEACDTLVRKGWLAQTPERLLRIHPLIREVAREPLRSRQGGYLEFLENMSDELEEDAYGVCIRHMGHIDWRPAAFTEEQYRQLAEWFCCAADFLDPSPGQLLWIAARLIRKQGRAVKASRYAADALAQIDPAAPPMDLARQYHWAAQYHYDVDWSLCRKYGTQACEQWELALNGAATAQEQRNIRRAYAESCALMCNVNSREFYYYNTGKKENQQEDAMTYGLQALELESRCGNPDLFLISRVHQMIASVYSSAYSFGSDVANIVFLGPVKWGKLHRSRADSRAGARRHMEEAIITAGQMRVPHRSWQAMLQWEMGDCCSKEAERGYYEYANQLLQQVSVPNEKSQARVLSNIADLYNLLGDDKQALAYKMQMTKMLSGKWYNRYIAWYMLFLEKGGTVVNVGVSTLNLIRLLLYILAFIPTTVVFIIAMLFLLKDLIVAFRNQRKKNREDE